MRRKLVVVVAIAAAYVLLTAGLAQAASVTQTNNGNKVTASYATLTDCHLGVCFYTAYCLDSNHHTPAAAKVLVSYVCQYRDASKVWHDFYNAPANYCTNCTDVQGSGSARPVQLLGSWNVVRAGPGRRVLAGRVGHQTPIQDIGCVSNSNPVREVHVRMTPCRAARRRAR